MRVCKLVCDLITWAAGELMTLWSGIAGRVWGTQQYKRVCMGVRPGEYDVLCPFWMTHCASTIHAEQVNVGVYMSERAVHVNMRVDG